MKRIAPSASTSTSISTPTKDSFLPANLNAIFMFIVIGALGFVGVKSTENNERLIQFAERSRSVETLLARLEKAVSEGVARREFDAAQQSTLTELARINVRLRELDLLYLELKAELVKLSVQPATETNRKGG